ncbi:MAG TPA: hypothetical protein VFZ53_05595 [Polyangiaceae bacterium]
MTWSVIYRSTDLALGESGASGLSEFMARELYERLVEKCKKNGGSVELKRDDDTVASITVHKGAKD